MCGGEHMMMDQLLGVVNPRDQQKEKNRVHYPLPHVKWIMAWHVEKMLFQTIFEGWVMCEVHWFGSIFKINSTYNFKIYWLKKNYIYFLINKKICLLNLTFPDEKFLLKLSNNHFWKIGKSHFWAPYLIIEINTSKRFLIISHYDQFLIF